MFSLGKEAKNCKVTIWSYRTITNDININEGVAKESDMT